MKGVRMNRLLAIGAALIISLPPAFWLASLITGYTDREYDVLLPKETVKIADITYTAQSIAELYQPVISDTPSSSPKPVVMWYEVVEWDDNTLVIVFRPSWSDERHPIPIINMLYRWYRQSVYGSEIDMEYIEIHVNRIEGEIERVSFETSLGSKYWQYVVPHVRVIINQSNSAYAFTATTPSGKVLIPSRPLPNVPWGEDGRIMLYVQTWNHLFTIEAPPWSTEPLSMPLRFMDDQTYRELKVARRSHGDIYSRVDERLRFLLTFVIWIVPSAGVIAWFAISSKRERSNRH